MQKELLEKMVVENEDEVSSKKFFTSGSPTLNFCPEKRI